MNNPKGDPTVVQLCSFNVHQENMSEESRIIFAICQRSTRCGIAIFENADLIHYDIVSNNTLFHGNFGRTKKSLSVLIQTYEPAFIILEEVIYPQHKMPKLRFLWSRVQRLAAAGRIATSSHSPRDVRKFFSSEKLASNADVAMQLTTYYPELQNYFGPTARQRVYWMPLFNAIALGRYFIQTVVKGNTLI